MKDHNEVKPPSPQLMLHCPIRLHMQNTDLRGGLLGSSGLATEYHIPCVSPCESRSPSDGPGVMSTAKCWRKCFRVSHSSGRQVGAGSQLHWIDFPPDEPLHVAWPSLQHGGWIPRKVSQESQPEAALHFMV